MLYPQYLESVHSSGQQKACHELYLSSIMVAVSYMLFIFI